MVDETTEKKGPIVLAEDSTPALRSMTNLLEDEGYLVLPYHDGRVLYDAIQEGLQYKLAIIDLSLPDVSGREIIELSRKIHPEVPIISISGYDNSPRESNQHLVKPLFVVDGLFEEAVNKMYAQLKEQEGKNGR